MQALSVRLAALLGPRELNTDELTAFLEEFSDALKERLAESETLNGPDGSMELPGFSDPEAFEAEHNVEIDASHLTILEDLGDEPAAWQLIVRTIIALFIAGAGYDIEETGMIISDDGGGSRIVLGAFRQRFGDEPGENLQWYF